MAGFSIFEGAHAPSLQAIADLCQVQEFQAGDEVFAQDTEPRHLHGVLDGEMELVPVFSEKVTTTQINYEEALTVTHEALEKPISRPPCQRQ